MSFGQQSGPPASAKQLSYLLSLVRQAGYEGFREARHPLGLTQRQAGGRFTGREASALIDRLLAGEGDDAERESDDGGDGAGRSSGARDGAARARASAAEERLAVQQATLVRGMPADVLAAELQRRGWTVSPP